MLVAENACCSVRELALGGEALAALGYRGREIGAVLARLLDEVAAEKLENKRSKGARSGCGAAALRAIP